MIVVHEQGGKRRAAYGEAVLEDLSSRLTAEFGRGFDVRNLRYMRQFYLAFPIRNALRSESASRPNRNALRADSVTPHAPGSESPALRPELSWRCSPAPCVQATAVQPAGVVARRSVTDFVAPSSSAAAREYD